MIHVVIVRVTNNVLRPCPYLCHILLSVFRQAALAITHNGLQTVQFGRKNLEIIKTTCSAQCTVDGLFRRGSNRRCCDTQRGPGTLELAANAEKAKGHLASR